MSSSYIFSLRTYFWNIKISVTANRLYTHSTIEAMTLNLNMTAQQNEIIQQTVHKERKRLLDFIRQRVPREEDAEDILQDVFYRFEAYRRRSPLKR